MDESRDSYRVDEEEEVPFWFWGASVTGLPSHVPSPEPLHDPRPYRVTFSLTPLDGPRFEPVGSDESDFVSDSNYRVSEGYPVESSTPVDTPHGRVHAKSFLLVNPAGRLGAIAIEISTARSTVEAYNIARTVFEFLNVRLVTTSEIPLRSDAARIEDLEGDRFGVRFRLSFPVLDFGTAPVFMPPVVQRIAGFYADAVASQSLYYQFLCYFSLVETLTTSVQGVFRKLSREHRVALEDLNGRLSVADLRGLEPALADLPYADVLKRYREFRVRVAHLITTLGINPVIAAATEDVSRAAHLLRIMAHRLLQATIRNYNSLRDAGIPEEILSKALEGAAVLKAENRTS